MMYVVVCHGRLNEEVYCANTLKEAEEIKLDKEREFAKKFMLFDNELELETFDEVAAYLGYTFRIHKVYSEDFA